jgi:hypothetical protein
VFRLKLSRRPRSRRPAATSVILLQCCFERCPRELNLAGSDQVSCIHPCIGSCENLLLPVVQMTRKEKNLIEIHKVLHMQSHKRSKQPLTALQHKLQQAALPLVSPPRQKCLELEKKNLWKSGLRRGRSNNVVNQVAGMHPCGRCLRRNRQWLRRTYWTHAYQVFLPSFYGEQGVRPHHRRNSL